MTTDEEKISRLYKQGEQPGPTAYLDNTILSAARDAVQDDATLQGKQQAKQSATGRSPFYVIPFSGGWRASASIAAVLVITVILVPLLQQEEMSPTVSRVAGETPTLEKEQDLIKASDVSNPGAAKENTAANITTKKRSKTAVLELQSSQLYQAPAKTVNASTPGYAKQFVSEEKIAPVQTLPEMPGRSLSPAQKPAPASAAGGTAVLHNQESPDQETHDYDQEAELRSSAEIKQQGGGVLTADKSLSVTMAAKPWLQKIRQLLAQGNLELAQQELDEFKLRYPDEAIEPSIVSQLKDGSVD